MMRCAQRGLAGIATVAVLAAAATTFTMRTEGAPTAKAAGCTDVDLSFARGTTEQPGVGFVGQAFVDAVTARLPDKTLTVYPVDYPATLDFVQAGDGTNDLSRHIQQVAIACPNTQFVLGGFSQGAAVVDVLMSNNPTGLTYDNPLPRALDQRIVAIALFGNPKQWSVNGVNVDLSIRRDQLGKVLDQCNPGDVICDPNGGGFDAHNAYADDGSAGRAADFVVAHLASAAASSSSAAASTTTGSPRPSAPAASAIPGAAPASSAAPPAPPARHGGTGPAAEPAS